MSEKTVFSIREKQTHDSAKFQEQDSYQDSIEGAKLSFPTMIHRSERRGIEVPRASGERLYGGDRFHNLLLAKTGPC